MYRKTAAVGWLLLMYSEPFDALYPLSCVYWHLIKRVLSRIGNANHDIVMAAICKRHNNGVNYVKQGRALSGCIVCANVSSKLLNARCLVSISMNPDLALVFCPTGVLLANWLPINAARLTTVSALMCSIKVLQYSTMRTEFHASFDCCLCICGDVQPGCCCWFRALVANVRAVFTRSCAPPLTPVAIPSYF